jgi:hypothetical protein
MREGERETTVGRLSQAAEQLSILGNELAATTAAAWDTLVPQPDVEEDPARAIATILQSTSDRVREHVLSLIEITYAQDEEAIAASGDPRAERSAVALGRINRMLEPVFELAQELAGHLRAAHSIGLAQQRVLRSSDLRPLDGTICELLVNTPIATGAGIALSPGLLDDQPLWMQWWVTAADGPVPLSFQFDPGRPNFYDYRTAVWYRGAALQLASHLADPHFDAGGTDQFMITAAIPAVVNTTYVGLGCAELTLDQLDGVVSPALSALDAPAALITPSGLVAASTDPSLVPGQAAPDWLRTAIGEAGAVPFAEIAPHVTMAQSEVMSWPLICFWG